MKASTALPTTGVRADELPDVAAAAADPGPFVSVALPTDRDTDDAAHRTETAWRDTRRELEGRGAAAAALDAVGDWVLEHRTDGDAVACVASASGLLVGAVGPAVKRPLAVWDSLPRLGRFVEWHQGDPPALLVLVDRTGADLLANVPGTTEDLAGAVATVEGETGPVIRRNQPGGWSQRRFQQRAMEAWRANGGEVAEAVTTHADAIGARLVVLAGDEHAVGAVVDQLPERLAPLVRRAARGRGAGSTGGLEAEAARLHRTVVAEDTVELIERLKQELGQRDRGVSGLAATVSALRTAAVDTLLVRDDDGDDRRLFLAGSDPSAVAVAEADLEGTDLRDGRAVDVLIRAAWGSGAAVRICPGFPELAEGVGALLRFPDPSGHAGGA
jgi:hypothetical protein